MNHFRNIRALRILFVVLILMGIAACGGGGGSNGGGGSVTLQSITVTPATPSVAVGLTQQMTATGHYSDASTQDLTASVTWSSGTPAVATINGTGLVTSVSVGTSVITATSGTVSGNTTLTVTPILQSITVTPATPSVFIAATQQMTATGNYSDGSTLDLTASVIWNSATPSVATVDAAGLASGVAIGSTVITATSGAVSGNTTLSVTLSWTWVSGSNLAGQAGVYGTQGVAAPGNVPNSRLSSAHWIDSSGNLWLLGGHGYDSTGAMGQNNDLWRFDGTNWTWISGSSVINQSGVYGTKGTALATNVPGARNGGTSWIDSSDNLWLFGGNGYDSVGTVGTLNDLWCFDGTNWTWVSGSNVANQSGVYGTLGTAAPTNMPGTRSKSISWSDNAGNFWLFGGYGYDSAGTLGHLNDLWRFDGTNWAWMGGDTVVNQAGIYGTQGVAAIGNVPGARANSVNWVDSSGNLWLFGGWGYDSVRTTWGNLSDLWKFNGTNWTWINGSNLANQTGTYGTKGTASAGNVPGARAYSVNGIDNVGNLWLFGGYGYDSTGTLNRLNDVWKYDGTNWTWMGGSDVGNQIGTYGTLGTALATNIPGARESGISWSDNSGNLWLFAGNGYDSTGTLGRLNDLWKLTP